MFYSWYQYQGASKNVSNLLFPKLPAGGRSTLEGTISLLGLTDAADPLGLLQGIRLSALKPLVLQARPGPGPKDPLWAHPAFPTNHRQACISGPDSNTTDVLEMMLTVSLAWSC